MSSLLSLVRNEQMKIYSRTRTWIMLGLLVFLVLAMGILMKYKLETVMPMSHALEFMSSAQMLASFITICTVIIAGDIVASEFSWGTVKLLLIRPASRGKILFSKYLSVLLFLLTMLLLLFIVSYFTGLILFGMGGAVAPDNSLPVLMRGYGLKAVDILMTATLAFMISSVFRSSSLAIGLSIFLMFTSGTAMVVLVSLRYTWAKYLLFANTNLSPYFEGGGAPLMEGMTLGFSLIMLVLYWLVFYGISWGVFTKRDVAGS
ncbi:MULTISPECIES: ABC transporter permease [Paenibacillus]|uniref:ABC transporter permease n=1 Tax=Paenibacillus TaxID=44249 RepID=UPI0022B9326B|nr:ABC transporter permease [Paenibacillus caseinilyticus]MCZ8523661.1 ABC transporter permease [Paenibacillus caseinilyticus]